MKYRNAIRLIITIIVAAAMHPAKAALLPPYMVNSVVALGTMVNVNPPGQPANFQWVTLGTGFFYGYKVKDDPDPKKKEYAIYLVTAGHVVSEFRKSGHGDLQVRINSKNSSTPSQMFDIPEKPPEGSSTWFYHPKFDPASPSDTPGYDIAAVPINYSKITELGTAVMLSDVSAADSVKLKSIDTSAGDGVFVLGFPMNLAGVERNYVIVREGVIARISEMLDHASPTFMLDSSCFQETAGVRLFLSQKLLRSKEQPQMGGHISSELSSIISNIPKGQLASRPIRRR